MAINPYISHGTQSEQTLYEDLIIESIKFYGFDIKYMQRNSIDIDVVMNEESSARFDTAHTIEVYLENAEGFEGEGVLLSKFGLELREEATFIIAKRTWNNVVSNTTRPMEGDLIYIPFSNSFFEISFVEHEQPFYQLNNLPIYRLDAKLFEYSGEIFATGNITIDGVMNEGYTMTLGLQNVVGTFQVDEIITVGTLQATITSVNSPTSITVANIINTANTERYFIPGDNITGQTSGATAAVTTITDNFPAGDNTAIEASADAILDFSEINPFGEP